MAYLDKNGIVRVDEKQQKHNDLVESLISELKFIQDSLVRFSNRDIEALHPISAEELRECVHICQERINRCVEICAENIMY